jgi:hypothetical protein
MLSQKVFLHRKCLQLPPPPPPRAGLTAGTERRAQVPEPAPAPEPQAMIQSCWSTSTGFTAERCCDGAKGPTSHGLLSHFMRPCVFQYNVVILHTTPSPLFFMGNGHKNDFTVRPWLGLTGDSTCWDGITVCTVGTTLRCVQLCTAVYRCVPLCTVGVMLSTAPSLISRDGAQYTFSLCCGGSRTLDCIGYFGDWSACTPSEKDAELAQKLGQHQPFVAVFPQEYMGQLAYFGPT